MHQKLPQKASTSLLESAQRRTWLQHAAALGVAGGSLLVSGLSWAQSFPSKALRVIVPQPPGGGFDTVARLLADRLSKQMGQSVVVENRPGSGTLVGTDAAAKAAPDDHRLPIERKAEA